MDAIGFTELRNNLAAVMDKVAADCSPVLITRPGGKENMVLMSAHDFAGWQETAYLLSSRANAAHILASIADHKAGLAEERELIDPAQAQQGR